MHKRPRSIIVLALINMVAPIFNILLNAIYIDAGVGTYFKAALSMKYLSMNWPIVILPIVCGVGIYACKKWSFLVYLAALSALMFFSYEGYLSKSAAIGVWPLLLVYVVNIVVVAFVLIPEVREIYFDPRLRWWETNPRFRSDFECSYSAENNLENSQVGIIGNFSIGGLFLRAKNFPEDGSKVSVSFAYNGQKVVFEGLTIHHRTQDTVGFSVEFTHTNESKKAAKEICADLARKGNLIESRFSHSEDDKFTTWLRTLLTTGKGLVPKKKV